MKLTDKAAAPYLLTGTTTVRYDKKQAVRNAQKWSDIPTYEVLRRLYHRHDRLVWEIGFILTWIGILYHAINNAIM